MKEKKKGKNSFQPLVWEEHCGHYVILSCPAQLSRYDLTVYLALPLSAFSRPGSVSIPLAGRIGTKFCSDPAVALPLLSALPLVLGCTVLCRAGMELAA